MNDRSKMLDHIAADEELRRAFLSRVARWLALHDRSSGFAITQSRVPDAIDAVLAGWGAE